jgi:hypothetical protein
MDMDLPGFRGHAALYNSQIHYGTIGGMIQAEGGAFSSSLATGPGFPEAHVLINLCNDCGETLAGGLHQRGEMFVSDREQLVVPMSVPGHHSFPADSTQCNDCEKNCAIAAGGCVVTAGVACAPLLAVPFVGAGLYLGCFGIATAACYAAGAICESDCLNIGSSCCPVACGPGCCESSETCSDSGQALCCSAGTQPCGGNCCERDEVCLEGVCCLRGSILCPDGTCCDNICGQCQGGTCVPVADGTPCVNGVCCAGKCAPCCGVGIGCSRPSDCCSGFCNESNQCDCFDTGEGCRFGPQSCCSGLCGVGGTCCLPVNTACTGPGDCCSGFCNESNQCDCFDRGDPCQLGPQSCCSGICGPDGICR